MWSGENIQKLYESYHKAREAAGREREEERCQYVADTSTTICTASSAATTSTSVDGVTPNTSNVQVKEDKAANKEPSPSHDMMKDTSPHQ